MNFYFPVLLDLQFYPMFDYFFLLLDDFELLRIIRDRGLGPDAAHARHGGVQRADAAAPARAVGAPALSPLLLGRSVRTCLETGRHFDDPLQPKAFT